MPAVQAPIAIGCAPLLLSCWLPARKSRSCQLQKRRSHPGAAYFSNTLTIIICAWRAPIVTASAVRTGCCLMALRAATIMLYNDIKPLSPQTVWCSQPSCPPAVSSRRFDEGACFRAPVDNTSTRMSQEQLLLLGQGCSVLRAGLEQAPLLRCARRCRILHGRCSRLCCPEPACGQPTFSEIALLSGDPIIMTGS